MIAAAVTVGFAVTGFAGVAENRKLVEAENETLGFVVGCSRAFKLYSLSFLLGSTSVETGALLGCFSVGRTFDTRIGFVGESCWSRRGLIDGTDWIDLSAISPFEERMGETRDDTIACFYDKTSQTDSQFPGY